MAFDVHEMRVNESLNPRRVYGGERSAAFLHSFFREAFSVSVTGYQDFLQRKRPDASIAEKKPTYEHPRVAFLKLGRYAILTCNPNAGIGIKVEPQGMYVKPFGGALEPVFTHKDAKGIPTVSGMLGYAAEAEGEHYVANSAGLDVALLGKDSTQSQKVSISMADRYDASLDIHRGMAMLGGCPDSKDELCVLGIIKIDYGDESPSA